MVPVPKAFALAFAQLGDRAVLAVLLKSVAVTLAIFAVGGLALWQGLQWALAGYSGTIGEIASIAALAMSLIAGWLLFRIVALFVIQFFADEVVGAVEARHYPGVAPRKLGLAEEAGNGFRGALRALAVNALALPFALALLVTGIGTALLFWAVNAWLLGRELQDMVWLRLREGAHEHAPLSGGQRFMLGGAVAALLLVPFVNLLAPILGAAAATHLVHGRKIAR